MERREYVQKLKEYTKEKGLSIYNYYLLYALAVRSDAYYTLPDFELNNPFLTPEDIKKLLESQDPRIVIFYALAMEKVISLQPEELTRDEMKDVVEETLPEEKVIGRDEITEVVNERLDELDTVRSPESAIDREDIVDIMNAELDRDISRDDIEEVIDENIEKKPTLKVIITSIGKKIANLLNGFAVIREEKTGRVHLYHHDAKTDTLKGERVYLNDQLKVNSGYYVNFQEYVDQMLDEIISKYPNPESIHFVRDDGEEKTIGEVLEEVFAILMKQGALRFGKGLKGKTITSYQELRNLELEGTETYANEPLRVGVYVRRDVLTRVFARYQAKVTVLEENNKLPIK